MICYHSSMIKMLTDTTITAWARLVRASQSVIGAIETDLKAAGLPGLDCYDVLLELERSGGELRPREIAKETLFARYSVTRLIDRLESQKLVKRIACPEDARGTVIQITRRGVSLRKKMWKVYAKAIRRHFADRLEAGDAEQLSKLLSKVIG